MTQQEYEQKKRECWEEFRTHVICGTDNPKGFFERAFDRAYALGKQTETITQEEIEDAAKDYANNVGDSDWERLRVQDAFKAGANFALSKQEKDAEETQPPKFKRGDRVKTKYNDEYTVSAVEPITDKYMYSLVCDNKSWCGMHLESKLRKVENK